MTGRRSHGRLSALNGVVHQGRQALLFGQARLFAYSGVMLVAFHLFVLFYEEPTLRRRFGGSYETYYLHVGRWWPRLTPWRGSGTSAS